MNGNFAKWGLSQLLLIVMLMASATAFAAGEALIHNSNNLGTAKGVWGVAGGKYGEFTCATCHNKSTNNVKRVADVVTAPLGSWSSSKTPTVGVVFNNMTGFGTDAGGHLTSTKVCQVCHTKTAYHRYNTTGQAELTHNNQTDCTTCHSHAKAFAASCNTCHGYPPKNTTPGVDGLVGGTNPQTYALGVSPASAGAHVKHDNANMRCTTCHNLFRNTTAHQRQPAQWGKIEMGFSANNANWGQFTGPAWTGGSMVGNSALNTGYTWVGNGGTTVSTAAQTTATCNVYCHGNWANSGGGANPSWVGGAAEAACGACHGASAATPPPTNAHVRHAQTLSTTTLGLACDKCHGAHPDNSHVTGTVKWDVSGLATAFATKPKYKAFNNVSGATGATSVNAPSVTFGTCSNLYCHSNVQGAAGTGAPTTYATVSWSASSVACDSCHWASGAFKVMSTGSHRVHVASNKANLACSACHSAAGSSTVKHSDGIVQVAMTQGTYTSATIKGGLKTAGVGIYGTCSATYCHSNGKGTATPIRWGKAPTGGCNVCHGTSGSTGAPDSGTPNSHPKHAPAAADCYKCHRLTASKTAGQLVSGTTDHIDSTIDARLAVPFTGLTNFSGVYNVAKTCSATYCHGGTVTTVAWGTAGGTNCNSCHVSKPNGLSSGHAFHIMSTSANYNYTQTAANNSTAAAYNFNCAACHGNTVANHVNGPVANGSDATIQFLYSSAGRGAAANTAYTRTATAGTDARGFKYSNGATNACNNTYCHSNGKAVIGNGISTTLTWSSATTGNCTACHGNEASAAGVLSGAHSVHMAGAGTGGNFKCNACHAQVITNADNRTLANKSRHVNKLINYSGQYAGKNRTCSNIYCHSNGKGAFAAIPAWTSGSTLDCQGCHATASLSGAYAHTVHIAKAATCAQCHNNTTTNSTTITGVKHIDGFVNMSGGGTFGTKAVSFKAVGTTCNNISCHSPAAVGPYTNTATWGVKATCETCHPKANLSGTHSVHMGALNLTDSSILYNMTANRTPVQNDTVKTHGFGCANCHPMSLTQHLNGSIDVDMSSKGVLGTSSLRFLNSTTAGKLPAYTAGACSNIYCHSNASRVAAEMVYKPTPVWAGSFTGDRCAACHDNQPATGAHAAHAVGNHTDNIYNGKSGKITVSSRKNTAHGNPNNSTTIGCYICHQATVTSAANDKNTKCVVCHYTGNTVGATLKGNASISNIKSHVNAAREIQFAPIKVVSKAQIRPESFKFYSGVWQRTTYKNMSTLSYDTAKVALDTATMWHPSTPMASNCTNIACHNGKTVSWNLANWNDPNKCMDCHNAL